MKILSSLVLLLLLLFSGFTVGNQRAQQSDASDEVAQLKKQVTGLEERIERLEKRLDRMARPRVIPLTSVGPTKEIP